MRILSAFKNLKLSKAISLSLLSFTGSHPALGVPPVQPSHFSPICISGESTPSPSLLTPAQVAPLSELSQTLLTSNLVKPDQNSDLTTLQAQLQKEAFHTFLKDVKKINSHLVNHVDPSHFKGDPALPRNQWISYFVQNISTPSLQGQIEKLPEDMFFSYYQDKPFARVSSLKKIQAPHLVTPNPTITKSYDIPLAREYPSDHSIDLDSYVAERFPKSLLKYFSDTGAELFAHFGTCEEALTLHQKGGFQEIHQFLGSKDGDDYPFYIMRNLNGNQSTRFVACNLVGADATRRIFQLIGPAFKHGKAHVIEHTRPAPLFKFTQKGNNLQLSPKDKVILGFQNTVWWALHKGRGGENWTRTIVTMDGPEISLYENTKTGQRIVNPTLVYGDEMLQTLHTLYDKGARDFVHLGTAGGLKEGLNMGDILLPTRFIKKDGTVELFANDALKLDLGSRLKDRVLSHSTQAWIPTIIEETKFRLKALQAQGADAVDVESLYISEFFQKHPDCRKSVIIMISDNPFGTHSYADENVTRGIPIKGVHQILPILLNPLPHSKL